MKQDYLQIRVFELEPEVFASGQLFDSDVALLGGQRVRSIVYTRPDNESEGQPLAADLKRTAESLGMTFVHFPIDPRALTRDVAEDFAQACEDLQRPMIVSGRSGPHATKIWETVEALLDD